MDPKFQQDIHPWIPKLKPAWKATFGPVLLAVLRSVSPGFIRPTKALGMVLVDLALGDGQPLSGTGLDVGARTVSNVGMRRLAGI